MWQISVALFFFFFFLSPSQFPNRYQIPQDAVASFLSILLRFILKEIINFYISLQGSMAPFFFPSTNESLQKASKFPADFSRKDLFSSTGNSNAVKGPQI